MKEILQKIPAINKILQTKKIKILMEKYPTNFVKEIIKKEIQNLKENIIKNNQKFIPTIEELAEKIEKKVKKENKNSLRRVINATGTILHTNLGRSLLSESVKENLINVAFNYSNLEFNIDEKKRGSRYIHLVDIIKRLTGAEDVLIVNNNAAAVMLVLNTLVKQKEIIVSRGELVEIGGAFRIPEIIKLSGGILKEVGTTNKTHLIDYEKEINENTKAILKVHTSNYKILGFSESVENQKIAKLAKQNNLISINDLGSGQFVDFRKFGLPKEMTVKEVVDSGIDVVTFSGDKLLGGPQAGIIVGKKQYIEQMKKNQLTRALRVDKMTISTLEATLKLYLDEKKALEEIPTLHMISISKERLEKKAIIFSEKINKNIYQIEIKKDKAEVGGGSFPASYLESVSVNLIHKNKTAEEIEKKLLEIETPIITRIKDNKIILDMRTLREKEFNYVIEQLNEI